MYGACVWDMYELLIFFACMGHVWGMYGACMKYSKFCMFGACMGHVWNIKFFACMGHV